MKIYYSSIEINGMCYVREVKNEQGDRAGYLLIDNNNRPIRDIHYYFKERKNKHGDEINSIKRKAYDLCYFYDFMNIINITPELLTNELLIEFINGYLCVIDPSFRIYDCIERSMLTTIPILEEYKNSKIKVLNQSRKIGLNNESIGRILNNIKMYLIFLKISRNKDIDLDKLFVIKDIRVDRDGQLLGHLNRKMISSYSVNGILKASKIPYKNNRKIQGIDENEVFEEEEYGMLFSELQNYSPSIKLLFNILDKTGMRISEVLALKVPDYKISEGDNFFYSNDSDIKLIDDKRDIWEVNVVYRPDNPGDLQIKFNKERKIHFKDSDKTFYDLYKQATLHRRILMKGKKKNHEYLIINTLGNRLMYPRTNQIFRKAMVDCGLMSRTSELTIHSIRHTYASRWIKCMRASGKDVELE